MEKANRQLLTPRIRKTGRWMSEKGPPAGKHGRRHGGTYKETHGGTHRGTEWHTEGYIEGHSEGHIHLQTLHLRTTLSRCNPGGEPGLRDSCVGFPLFEISFVSSESRPNALSLCLYHDYRLRQKQGGEQRAGYFSSWVFFASWSFFFPCPTSCVP